MKDKDINTAIRLLTVWAIVFSIGLVIADELNVAAGLTLSISATIVAVVIVYCDWRNEQTKNRLDNYIDDANERMKEVLKEGDTMPNALNLTAYECAVCHRIYAKQEDAEKCEKSHECPCEKWDFCRFGYDEYYSSAFISGIYFKEKKIVLIRNNDDTNYERDSTAVKYCPFCGRKL